MISSSLRLLRLARAARVQLPHTLLDNAVDSVADLLYRKFLAKRRHMDEQASAAVIIE